MKLLSKNPFKEIMEKDNMTYQELGNLFGISKQSMHMIVNENCKPSSKVILQLLIYYKQYYTPLQIYIYYYAKENLSVTTDN